MSEIAVTLRMEFMEVTPQLGSQVQQKRFLCGLGDPKALDKISNRSSPQVDDSWTVSCVASNTRSMGIKGSGRD